jgi:hypothetical protein
MTRQETYAAAMSGRPLVDIGQIPEEIRSTLATDVRCGNLRRFRAPWAYIAPYGFSTAEKTWFCLMRGKDGRDWTREMLLAFIRAEGEAQYIRLAEKGIIP